MVCALAKTLVCPILIVPLVVIGLPVIVIPPLVELAIPTLVTVPPPVPISSQVVPLNTLNLLVVVLKYC